MKFAVTIVLPPGYVHSAVFYEVAEIIHDGSCFSVMTWVLQITQGALSGRQHIVLGSNLLPQYPLPLSHDAILYNLEQVEI